MNCAIWSHLKRLRQMHATLTIALTNPNPNSNSSPHLTLTLTLSSPSAHLPNSQDQMVALGAFKDSSSLDYFAVFDGHGGSEASAFCSEELHKNLEGIKPNGPNQWTKEFEEAYRKTHRGCVSRSLPSILSRTSPFPFLLFLPSTLTLITLP